MHRALRLSMVAIWLGVFVGSSGLAKGLDELTPQPEATPAEAEKAESPTSVPTASPPPTPTPSGSPVPSPVPSPTPSPETDKEETEELPIERSELSKKLENRLYLAPSLNLARVIGAKGSWSSAANGNFAVGWLAKESWIKESRLFVTARYAPFDFILQKNSRYYRGVAEGWYVGGQALFKLTETLFASGGVEAGYFRVHLDSADSFEVLSKDEEKGGGTLVVASSLDWQLLEKLLLGPHLGLGLGSLKTIQLGTKATFFF